MMSESGRDAGESAPGEAPSAVIGVGASAGGLEALRAFFAKANPADQHLAYLVVQHLAPDHESMMPDLLGKSTDLRVTQASDGQPIGPGCVYIIPPGKYLRVRDGRIYLSDPQPGARGSLASVDALFRSMAEMYAERSVGVVLSGLGSDGSAGLRAIAAAGGICAAQSPTTAGHDAMPSAAQSTGVLHFARPPGELRETIINAIDGPPDVEGDAEAERGLDAILQSVKKRRGSDFHHYKPNTIIRRVSRRMGMLQINRMSEYAQRLAEDEEELDRLSRDLLIGVTSFFRDPGVFQYIRREIAPLLVRRADPEAGVRVWIPGCSTGEEAYTLAMILLDEIRKHGRDIPLQVFASDIDRRAIEYARRGHYPPSVVVDIPQDLRERYMRDRDDGTSEPVTRLREAIIMAEQDLLQDPSFSRVDMISCRNLLIYLKPEIQRKLIGLFHFALNPRGLLLLGTSESAVRETGRFEEVEKSHRLFRRLGLDQENLPALPIRLGAGSPAATRRAGGDAEQPPRALGQRLQEWISRNLAPAAVVVDEKHQVVYLSAQAHHFLRLPEGEPSKDLYAMLDRGAAMRIRAILGRVMRTGEQQPPRPIVLRRGNDPEGPLQAKVEIRPLEIREHDPKLFVLILREVSMETSDKFVQNEESQFVDQFEQELRATREDLHTTIEEMESTNEELRASNEESMSVNEKLQSANEELETSKEELQSLNEELTTVNSQLREKLEEVEAVNNDISNLLTSTDMGVLFLDTQLRIKRFTPSLLDLFRLAPGDVGRPIEDITRKFSDPMLESDARSVLERLGRSEKQVRDQDGRIYQQRILPYKTHTSRIEGVVVTYTEVTKLQKTIVELDRALRRQRSLAKLGSVIVREKDLQKVFDTVVREVREAMGADYSKVLRFIGDDQPMEIVAGLGWDPEIVAVKPIDTDDQSQASYALGSDDPVIFEDLAKEKRFSGSRLLIEHGVRSGISCVIHAGSVRWGVLSVHSRHTAQFSEQEADFIQSAANLIGQAQVIHDSRLRVAIEAKRLEFALAGGDIGAWVYNHATGDLVANERQRHILHVGPNENYDGELFWSRVHRDDIDALRGKVERVIRERSHYRADFRIKLPSGETRWLHGAGSVGENEGGELVLYGVNFDITQRKEAERLLKLSKSQLEDEVVLRGQIAEQRLREIRRMNHEMVIAESVERRRLATELHDNLAQVLGLGLMKLGAMEQDDGGVTRAQVQELREILQQANNTTRSVMAQLTPQVLEELGLASAIDWLAEQTEQIYNLPVVVDRCAAPIDLGQVEELTLFRAVRELLINVAKHADVQEARVVLDRGDLGFRIEVRDHGTGFDAKQVMRRSNRRFGLMSMQERMSHIGGRARIESSLGDGCIVTLDAPDPSPREDEEE